MCSLVIWLLRGVRESAPRLRKLRLEQRHRFGHTRQEPNAATGQAFSPGVEVLPPRGFDESGGRGADPLGRAVVSVSQSSSSLCSSTLRGSVSAAASIIPTVPLGDVSSPPPA